MLQTAFHLIIFLLFGDADGTFAIFVETVVEMFGLDDRHLAERCLAYLTHLAADLTVKFVLVLAEFIQCKRTVFSEVHLHVAAVLLFQLWEGHLYGQCLIPELTFHHEVVILVSYIKRQPVHHFHHRGGRADNLHLVAHIR